MILDVSMKLLLKWFSAVLASSSDLKPTKPNLRNLPSFVNFRQQSVSVPKAANSFRKRSSFICRKRAATREAHQTYSFPHSLGENLENKVSVPERSDFKLTVDLPGITDSDTREATLVTSASG